MILATGVAAAAAAVAASSAPRLLRKSFKRRLKSRAARARLWDRLYGWDWGPVSTNNYGYAPAEGAGAERYQLQMYRELLRMLKESGFERPETTLLEVSCGRGGGLAEMAGRWPGKLRAVGLDLSREALAAAERAHGGRSELSFVHGSALDLPFPDSSFDVVVNVEASHEYGDLDRFLAEVRRVLRPDGVFLHCDSRQIGKAADLFSAMSRAGFAGTDRDISANVTEACRLDSPRRAELLRAVPWPYAFLIGKWMRSYAALEGSSKFDEFTSGRRRYYMSCLRKLPERAVSAAPALEALEAAE